MGSREAEALKAAHSKPEEENKAIVATYGALLSEKNAKLAEYDELVKKSNAKVAEYDEVVKKNNEKVAAYDLLLKEKNALETQVDYARKYFTLPVWTNCDYNPGGEDFMPYKNGELLYTNAVHFRHGRPEWEHCVVRNSAGRIGLNFRFTL